MGVLRVLSRHGDDRYEWDQRLVEADDPEAQAAVREAERIFAAERAFGSTAFIIRPDQPPIMSLEFDPHAEQIIVVPRVVGG